MGLRMKNVNIVTLRWKIRLLGGGGGGVSRKTKIEGGGLPKKGRLGQFANSRGLGKKDGCGVF